MADFGRGVKAGAVSGIIYGIISSISSVIIVSAMWETLVETPYEMLGYTGTYDFSGLMVFMLPMMIVMGIIVGIIAGIIFGLIYAAIYNSLPGSSSVIKAMVLALIFWVIFNIALGYGNIAMYGMMYYAVVSITVGLISSLIWGWLLGVFWDKFGGKQQVQKPEGM